MSIDPRTNPDFVSNRNGLYLPCVCHYTAVWLSAPQRFPAWPARTTPLCGGNKMCHAYLGWCGMGDL